MHTYKGVYMPIKKLYVSIFIFITSFSKIKCRLCENKSMYGKMDITIRTTLKFCICSYKEVKSSHGHDLPNLSMPWSILTTFVIRICFLYSY